MSGPYGDVMPTLPIAWLTLLATSELRLAIYGLRVLFGLVRYIHLIGMAVFVGMVVLLDLRGVGLFPPASLDAARARLGMVLSVSFWVTIGSGVVLFVYDPLGIGLHTMFLPKLVLVALGYVHARWVQRLAFVRRTPELRRVTAVWSLAIWLLVIGASTWNHVERPVNVKAALRAATVGKP